MKKLNVYFLSFTVLSLAGCSTKQATYNAATYVLNKECAAASNCSGAVNSTYQENQSANQEYEKLLAKEKEAARLKEIQQELESKKKPKKN